MYLARQVNIDREVAIKVLSSEAAQKDSVVRRFENEARIISKLRHPNTLKLIDFGKTRDGRIFIVVEYLHGQPLDVVLEAGAIGVERTLQVLIEASDSLEEAHGQGVIHRDLKPGNLYVERVGNREVIKVLDFGIAKLTAQTSHTATGMVFGTPAYMSPEQARGEPVDLRSDIYSLGIIAYECLAGRPPFEAETPVSLLLQHVQDIPVRLADLVPPITVFPELDDLVMSMLAKDPEDRPQTAEEIGRASCRERV